ncbi:hypothetical protein PtA15_9A172 [Puccinia triticina]|uniref:Uncharacterized protein n=1 Tax=Puccinia triticina TaxID=208348 RepID=A0ABY7CZA5_9BASI|nr:uncharacterized protein PtA15_9A172 [Puccinia triticina]WAQ88047.1 hypothetical protein PtA15_9A172 [Puccinia triticina]
MAPHQRLQPWVVSGCNDSELPKSWGRPPGQLHDNPPCRIAPKWLRVCLGAPLWVAPRHGGQMQLRVAASGECHQGA